MNEKIYNYINDRFLEHIKDYSINDPGSPVLQQIIENYKNFNSAVISNLYTQREIKTPINE